MITTAPICCLSPTSWNAAGGNTYVPTAEEMEQFREAAAPIRDWYLETFAEEGEAFLTAFEAAIARAEETVGGDRNNALQATTQ